MNGYNTCLEQNEGYDLRDCCFGQVIRQTQQGIFIRLEDGTEAFAYNGSSLRPGSKVFCSVLKFARERLRMLVSVDSVVEYAA